MHTIYMQQNSILPEEEQAVLCRYLDIWRDGTKGNKCLAPKDQHCMILLSQWSMTVGIWEAQVGGGHQRLLGRGVQWLLSEGDTTATH